MLVGDGAIDGETERLHQRRHHSCSSGHHRLDSRSSLDHLPRRRVSLPRHHLRLRLDENFRSDLRSTRKFGSPRIGEKPLGIVEPMAIIAEDE
nr:hypothetical protein Itr_chr06CG19990 [Ipomoea trifida]